MSDSSTTLILRRRIRHWKTTAAGVATILAPVLAILFPEAAVKIMLVSSALTGAGLMAAADATTVQPPK